MNNNDGSKFSITVTERALLINNGRHIVKLSKNQQKLFTCLINSQHEKNAIIHAIWGDADKASNQNNFRQLIRRTRQLLQEHGLSPDMLHTIPHYGLRISDEFIIAEPLPHAASLRLYNDRCVSVLINTEEGNR